MHIPSISKNRYFDALLKLFILSAVLHIAILFFYAVASGDIRQLNYLGILDFTLFFPAIIEGFFNNMAALFLLLAVYVSIFIFFSKPRR